jgi:hypothetical protein
MPFDETGFQRPKEAITCDQELISVALTLITASSQLENVNGNGRHPDYSRVFTVTGLKLGSIFGDI